MTRIDRLGGPTTLPAVERKSGTATVRFYCGKIFSEDWTSEQFQVPTIEVDGKTGWDSPEYNQAFEEAQAQHDAQCKAPEYDIRTSMSFYY